MITCLIMVEQELTFAKINYNVYNIVWTNSEFEDELSKEFPSSIYETSIPMDDYDIVGELYEEWINTCACTIK